MGCPHGSLLARFDEARGPERSALLEHVRVCGRCREAFLAADPSRVFAFLGQRSVPMEVLESVSAGVSEATRNGDSGAEPARAGKARSMAWAAAVLLAATLGSLLFRPVSGPRPPELAGNVSRRAALPAAEVKLLSSPEAARVVDLTVGDTQVVMIFDERIGL